MAFLIHVTYYCFHSLELYKVCNIYPRSIKSLFGIVLNVNKFNKGSLEFHNDLFVDNCEGSLLGLVF